jgi:flagellar biosynthesis protein FlhF
MRRVREELGPEAVILHSKQRRPWGPLRLVQSGEVEILAAVDREETPRPAARPAWAASADALRDDVTELRHLLVRWAGARMLAPEVVPFHARLLAAGVPDTLALRITDGLPHPSAGPRESTAATTAHDLEERLAAMIRVGGPAATRRGRVALVGPTGAGKTISLAKLAARAKIGGVRPEILDLDGTGLGTPAPLEAFATILGIPYCLALTGEEVAAARARSTVPDLTLIDTPGLVPGDHTALARLGTLLRGVRPDEVHLVLSATTKIADAMAAVRAFSVLAPTHLLFTRLDETTSCGSILSVGVESGLPISFLGNGREIPTDLVQATPSELTRRTLQGEPTS